MNILRIAARIAARPIPIDKDQIRSLAESIVDDLWYRLTGFDDNRSMLFSDAYRSRGSFSFKGGVFNVTNVMGDELTIPVWVVGDIGVGDQWINGANVELDDDGRPESIEVLLNLWKTPNKLKSKSNRAAIIKELERSLSHEITHSSDKLRGTGSLGINRDEEEIEGEVDEEEYYNDPQEVRAFMRNVVDEVIERVKDEVNYYGTDILNDIGGYDIDTWLNESDTWERIEDHLNEDNRRLILRAVAREVSDNAPKIKEEAEAAGVPPTIAES